MTQGTTKERVLIIEQEPEMGIYLSNLLGPDGFETIVSKGETKDLCRCRDAEPHLIILDAMIPKAGGFQIYRFIKDDPYLKNVPLIMLSNIDRDTFFQQLKCHCVCPGQQAPEPDAYLEKPPEAEHLLALSRMLTAKKSLRTK